MTSIDEVLEALESKSTEIESKINKKDALEYIGALSILITSYSTLLSHHKKLLEEMAESEYQKHRLLLDQYNKKMREMNSLRRNAHNIEQKDLAEAKLDKVSYAENVNTQQLEEEDFMSTNTRRLNSYLMTAIDSLDSLKKQGKVLDGTREKMLGGLKRMGFSEELVEKISGRYSNDKVLFMVGLFVVIVVFFLLRFIIK